MNPTKVDVHLFGDALLADWFGPVFVDPADGWPKPESRRLDLTRPEAAWRLCVVVAAGERCECPSRKAVYVVTDWKKHGPAPNCQACNGTGYLRKPAPAWHLLPVKFGGTFPDFYENDCPALLACHATSVAGGGMGIVDILSPWVEHDDCWIRKSVIHHGNGLYAKKQYSPTFVHGWQNGIIPGDGNLIWRSGDEVGEEAKAILDRDTLAAGYPLLGPLRLPEPK